MQFLFYFFLYGFVVFLILLLVHFAIHPIFQFIPGGKGIISVPTSSDYIVYWNAGQQPTTVAPVANDTLNTYPFLNSYTLSIDILITDTSPCKGLQRLIFFSTDQSDTAMLTAFQALTDTSSLALKFSTLTPPPQFICYVDDDTNNLIVTYFLRSGSSTVQRSSFPIQNIPLYTPFRLSIVYDMNIFTVYYNGVQVSQTPVSNTSSFSTNNQKFYANTTVGKCGNVQNLLLWNRSLPYPELKGVPLALTGKAKFGSTDTSIVTSPLGTGAKCQ